MQGFSPFSRRKRAGRKAQEFSEQRALERIEAQFAVGGWCVGVAAGVLRALNTPGEQIVLLWALVGLLLVVAAAAAGSFLGVGLRLLWGRLRREEAEQAQESPEVVASMTLGSGIGSFAATLGALLLGAWASLPWAAAGGALVCSAVFILAGDLVRVLIRMLAMDSRAARNSPHRKE